MQQSNKDSAIRLFGKKITLPARGEFPTISGDDLEMYQCRPDAEGEDEKEKSDKDSSEEEIDTEAMLQDDAANPNSNTDQSMNPENTEKASSIEEETEKLKTENEQSGATDSQEKTLKKPDKLLPCPRCNSMDTKFCYYNNYNINQPRYFCKACQRYWTAGGTMRNVPVGAGRRKNKNSASHYPHISISEALLAARIDATNGLQHSALKSNSKVLIFGLDAPICDSVMNLGEKKVVNGMRNGFHHGLEGKRIQVLSKGRENGDDCSSASSITVSNSKDEGSRNCKLEMNGFSSPIPCLPGVPWPYPQPQAFCPPGFPMPIYPAPYWNCNIQGAWNVPLLSPQSSTSSNLKTPTSGQDPPTLGKHCRELDAQNTDDLENERPPKQKKGSILVPKTLRIDDPSEAAKSSIWATLGIKNVSLGGKGRLFKAFQPKSDQKSHVAETSPALRANPAALSRSLNFQETS